MGMHVQTSLTVLPLTGLKRNCATNCTGSTSLQILSMEKLKNKKSCMFVYPNTLKPTLTFFEVLEMDDFDQTAVGMTGVIKFSFERNKPSNLLDKLIYLPADGASVNSRRELGLIAQLGIIHLVLQSSIRFGFEGRSRKFHVSSRLVPDARLICTINRRGNYEYIVYSKIYKMTLKCMEIV